MNVLVYSDRLVRARTHKEAGMNLILTSGLYRLFLDGKIRLKRKYNRPLLAGTMPLWQQFAQKLERRVDSF